MKYNSAFFGLFENVFKLLKNEYGKNKALEHFSSLIGHSAPQRPFFLIYFIDPKKNKASNSIMN